MTLWTPILQNQESKDISFQVQNDNENVAKLVSRLGLLIHDDRKVTISQMMQLVLRAILVSFRTTNP